MYLPIIALTTICCSPAGHAPVDQSIESLPSRIEVRYHVHFTHLHMVITRDLVDYRLSLQGPGDYYKRPLSVEQFGKIAQWLLASEPFSAEDFAHETDEHGAVYCITVVYPYAQDVYRAVAHRSMFQEGRYPRLRRRIKESRIVRKFKGIAPDEELRAR